MPSRPHLTPHKAILISVAALIFVLTSTSATRRPSDGVAGKSAAATNNTDQTPIRGSERCAFCHQSEVEGYALSAMAHALRRAAQSEPSGEVNLPNTKITATNETSGYHQQLRGPGESENYKIDYVVGSGNHASGYLINLNGHLFQSPIAWYKSRNAYDVAPGYENMPNPDFTRPVGEVCVFCHSGTSLHVPNTLNQFREPPFAAEAITCERCHGPVERHLADPRAGTIVNPAKLAPAARDSTCEQCHLFGVARVPNPGKQFSDFLPGQPLEQTFSIYHNILPTNPDAPSAGADVGAGLQPGHQLPDRSPTTSVGAFKVISHVEQLALSRCACSSNQQLWCGTCHDLHNKPIEPIAYYREKCLTCHATNFPAPTLAITATEKHPDKTSDCITCHMPRRDAKDGGHTAFTDHRIQRRPVPESDLPTNTEIAAWREPSPNLRTRNIGIAHIDAGVGRRSQSMVIQGYRELTEAQSQFANDPELFSWIGQALLLGRQSKEAEIAFERAAQLAPTSPVNEGNAASAYAQAGDLDNARLHLERAVAIDPLYLPASGPLVRLYRRQGKTAEADALSTKIEALTHPTAGMPATGSLANASAIAIQPAEKNFKNIQVLKGAPSDQLFPTMSFIASSLGVNCTFCHVEGHFDKDEKKPKETARAMIKMTLALNKNNFAANPQITCYSCHRGSQHPAGSPAIASDSSCSGELASPNGCSNATKSTSSTAPPASPAGSPSNATSTIAPAPPLPTNLPTATEILDHYITAVGGANSIEQITSRAEKGTITNPRGSTPIEILTTAPDRQAFIRHLPTGDATTLVNGTSAWFTMRGHQANPLQGADLDATRMDADIHFPLHLRDLFPNLRREYPETTNNGEAYVLIGEREGLPPIKLYFDQATGLLIRQIRYADTPIGQLPTQIDYSDFRAVSGVQLPFRITISQPNNRETIRLDQIQQNIPIDPTHFSIR
jgi:photosynthetic reaction center cytochrome c subunit